MSIHKCLTSPDLQAPAAANPGFVSVWLLDFNCNRIFGWGIVPAQVNYAIRLPVK